MWLGAQGFHYCAILRLMSRVFAHKVIYRHIESFTNEISGIANRARTCLTTFERARTVLACSSFSAALPAEALGPA